MGTTLYFPAEFKALMGPIAIRSCDDPNHYNFISFPAIKGAEHLGAFSGQRQRYAA